MSATQTPSSADKTAIVRLHRLLMESQFWPPERLRAHQRQSLEQLVRHARAHVPFYRDTGRLDPLFAADDGIAWDRWAEIPPLTRREVQSSFEALRSEKVPRSHGKGFIFATSGSTGEPVKIISTELARTRIWAALRLREIERHAIDTSQRLVHLHPYMPDHFNSASFRRYYGWYKALSGLIPEGERLELSDLRPAPELLDELLAIAPRYINIQPTALELVTAHDPEHRLGKLNLGAVFTRGEHFADGVKAKVEKHLKCRIIEAYASTECGMIGGGCAVCGRIHVHAEVVHLEALTEAGVPAMSGEIGRVIVTPLYNYAMPLIRYDHADYAVVGEAGRCTITLPTLDEVIGKKRVSFVFPGGRVIRPTLPTEWIVECLGAQTFQIAQVAEDRCEIRIVRGRMGESDMRFDELTNRVRSIWWDGLKITYRIVEGLPRRSIRSKIQMIVQEMPDASV